MHNSYLQYYKPNVLIGVVAIFGIFIFLAKDYWGLSLSVIGVITGLLFVIDQWLWKTKLFSLMFWTDNFSGRYEGFLEYEFRDENCVIKKGKLKHVKIIEQKGSQISIYSFTKKNDGTSSSMSENKGVYIEKIIGNGHYQLIYNYLNDGNSELGFPPHYGTEIIKFIKDGKGKRLSGRYYTERLPFTTKGKFVDLKWVNNNKSHDF